MSSFALFEHAVGSVLALRGVKRCIVVTSAQDSLQARKEETLPRSILLTARDLARTLLEQRSDRRDEQLLGHVVVAQRFDDVAVAVIGDATLDVEDAHRKLNVIAIRVRVTASKEGPGPLALSLREAYVSVAGLLSGMVFDRALEELQRAHPTDVLDSATLREFANSLADSLTPPTNYLLRERLQEAMSTWDTPSGSFRSAAPAAAPARVVPPLHRPATVPRMAAVQQVVRELIGPFGDLLVQRALESNVAAGDATGAKGPDTEKLITTIAAQLPAQHRARFMVEGRAAMETGRARAEDTESRDSDASSSAVDNQRPQRQ